MAYNYHIIRLNRNGNEIEDNGVTYEVIDNKELPAYKTAVRIGLVHLYRWKRGEPDFHESWNGTWHAYDEAYEG
jgi:hypothetical protein